MLWSGASGSGKTTLLNVLNFRSTGYFQKGEILINGSPANNDHVQNKWNHVQIIIMFK